MSTMLLVSQIMIAIVILLVFFELKYQEAENNDTRSMIMYCERCGGEFDVFGEMIHISEDEYFVCRGCSISYEILKYEIYMRYLWLYFKIRDWYVKERSLRRAKKLMDN